jgi:enoyl-CoA hydratase/carnithine racemase
MSQRVLVTISDHVAHVRLNRPDKRNGLDLAMFEAIVAAGTSFVDNRSVRAVVLSGEGRSFCSGLDWQAFMASLDVATEALLARPAGHPANLAQRVSRVWADLDVPVLAAVHGHCLGGGLQIALGADMRYVHPHTQLSVMEVRYGLIPDMGITTLLPGLVRPDIARELTFTGRIFTGDEALAYGFATRVCDDPLAEAMTVARTIASKSPEAVQAAKRMFRESRTMDVRAALLFETELQMTLMRTPHQLEAVQAAFERREPVFIDAERLP